MPPPRRPGRPFLSASADGQTFSGGRSGQLGQDRDWFPVRLTSTDGETADGHLQYTGYEVWIEPSGSTVEVVGARVLTAAQPGVYLGPEPSPLLPVLALARLGPGSGGRFWELTPLGDDVAESGASGDTNDDGSLGYFCIGPLQTVVGCDAEGGLVVTTTTFCVSAVIVGGRIRFTVTEAADPGDCNPASGTTNDCVHTAGPAPLVFAMTVGTFDNPTFADLEGGWSLTYAGSCSWTAGSPGGMGTGWGLTVTADGIVLAGTTGGNTVRYVLLGAAMDCGSLTLPRDLEDGSGVTQPATLTLTPA